MVLIIKHIATGATTPIKPKDLGYFQPVEPPCRCEELGALALIHQGIATPLDQLVSALEMFGYAIVGFDLGKV